MRMRSKLPWLLIGALVVATHPAGAAILLLGGEEGTEQEPEPTEGAQTEENWNPTVNCEAEEGDTIFDLLDCLLAMIANPPPPCIGTPYNPGGYTDQTVGGEEQYQDVNAGGNGSGDDCSDPQSREDFLVQLLPRMPPYGIEILTLDLEEIERISLWENDPGIQTTELQLNRPDRFVRIGEIVEEPFGEGEIYVTLNSVTFHLRTAVYPTSVELTAAMIAGIRAMGYTVDYVPPYLIVSVPEGFQTVKPLTRVQFRSTDPAIVSSSIGIYPVERPEEE